MSAGLADTAAAVATAVVACLQRPRVLTTALQAHAAEHGIVLVSLNPSDPDQWEAEHLHAIVHKLPEDAGEDAGNAVAGASIFLL